MTPAQKQLTPTEQTERDIAAALAKLQRAAEGLERAEKLLKGDKGK
jgi:hypothetical protein